VIPDSYRSNFRPFYLQPPDAFLSAAHCARQGQVAKLPFSPSRDGFRSWLRHTGAGSPMHLGRIEFNIVLFMDWSFTSGCSPPRLSTTQLPSATDRPVLLSDRDLHPTIGAYFQAHPCSHLRGINHPDGTDFELYRPTLIAVWLNLSIAHLETGRRLC
jgi:hypothetical protein